MRWMAGVLLLGCSPVAGPTEQRTFSLTSEPPGAKIEVDELFVGVTPLMIELPCQTIWHNQEYLPSRATVLLVATPPSGVNGDVQVKHVRPRDGPARVDFTMTLKRVSPVERVERERK